MSWISDEKKLSESLLSAKKLDTRIAEEQARRKARRHLLNFSALTWGKYSPSTFHKILCSYLDRVSTGEIKRLMVFAPPQHGKSEIISRRFPAFMLGQNPDTHVLGCSYAATLASNMNRDVQRVIESTGYASLFPRTRLNSKQTRGNTEGRWVRNSDEFEIVECRGSYRSAGVGAGIVGKPADLIVIDDPVAGVEQAYSPTYRQKLWDWYGAEASTRQSPDCRIVLMHQRWHEDDLAGRLLKIASEDPKADQWTVVRFPALAYPKDSPLRCPEDWREEGEPLWPEKFSREFIEARKATMSPFQYAAVYDQNPQPLAGAHFHEEWFGRWNPFTDGWWILAGRKVEIRQCQIIVVVDPAATEKQTSDYTGMGAFALTPQNDLLILEMIEDHIKIEDIPSRVLALCQRWRASAVLYEDTGFQINLVRECRRTQGMPPVREVSPQSRSKLVRATEAINRAASRQIWLPDSAPWTAAFIDEAIRFTGLEGGKDNLIDCLAYAALMQSNKLDASRQGAGIPRVHQR